MPQIKKITFAALSFFAGLLLLEMVLNLMSFTFPRVEKILVGTPKRIISDEAVGWKPNPKHPEHDERGFRNDEMPEKVDILALGDSQTYGDGVVTEERWSNRLGRLLDQGTYNISSPGYSPLHSILLWEEILSFRPKKLIQAVYFGNDIFDAYYLVYEKGFLTEMRSENPDLSQAIELQSNKTMLEEWTHLFQQCVDFKPSSGSLNLKGFVSSNSKIYGLGRAVKRTLEKRPHGERTFDFKRISEKAGQNPDHCELVEVAGYKSFFMPQFWAFHQDLDDPRIEEGFRLLTQGLAELAKRAEDAKIAFHVLLIPTKEKSFEPLMARENMRGSGRYQQLLEKEERIRERIKRFLTDHKIPFTDSLAALQKVLQSNQPTPYFPQDGHLNAAGNKAIADLLKAQLARS